MQMRWDKTEGSGVANTVLAGTPTGVPPKQLLMQIALCDEQVPNLGSYWEARTMDIPVLGPTPTTPWGLSVQQSPLASGQRARDHGRRRSTGADDEHPGAQGRRRACTT